MLHEHLRTEYLIVLSMNSLLIESLIYLEVYFCLIESWMCLFDWELDLSVTCFLFQWVLWSVWIRQSSSSVPLDTETFFSSHWISCLLKEKRSPSFCLEMVIEKISRIEYLHKIWNLQYPRGILWVYGHFCVVVCL